MLGIMISLAIKRYDFKFKGLISSFVLSPTDRLAQLCYGNRAVNSFQQSRCYQCLSQVDTGSHSINNTLCDKSSFGRFV